jgi:hypothetical protein
MPRTLHLALTAAALLVAALLAGAWLASRRSAAQLAATLASQNALLDQAAAREQQRNTQLAAALASISAEKQRVHTPQQAAAAIPIVLPPLPLPVHMQLPDLTPSPIPQVAQTSVCAPFSAPTSLPPAPAAAPALLSIPLADLQPLYNSLQDCRACALESDATKKDLADEHARVAALTRERDAAISAARGGSFWSRLKHAAKWFAIGAAAGAAATATAAAHHSP